MNWTISVDGCMLAC